MPDETANDEKLFQFYSKVTEAAEGKWDQTTPTSTWLVPGNVL